ncbi:MAG TPA: helix-turn-helix transcriptional regulator [Vicinamibacterales bacterium]|nr:helix-turn-helix transcriptional regulator [Vicinamibacterales bacterium]
MSALGEFEQLVLFAVLRLADDGSGVAIRDEILARTGRDISPGAIYTTLGRLEERGLVRATVTTPVTAKVGRPRKHYELRPAGAKALRESYDNIQALAVGLLPRLNELAKGR